MSVTAADPKLISLRRATANSSGPDANACGLADDPDDDGAGAAPSSPGPHPAAIAPPSTTTAARIRIEDNIALAVAALLSGQFGQPIRQLLLTQAVQVGDGVSLHDADPAVGENPPP
jgi:hypothetical protein